MYICENVIRCQEVNTVNLTIPIVVNLRNLYLITIFMWGFVIVRNQYFFVVSKLLSTPAIRSLFKFTHLNYIVLLTQSLTMSSQKWDPDLIYDPCERTNASMLVKTMYLNGVHEILPIAYKVFETDSGRDPGQILFYLSIALINIEKAYLLIPTRLWKMICKWSWIHLNSAWHNRLLKRSHY